MLKKVSQYDHQTIVVGISGGSGSGKTWLTQQLKHIYPKSVCLFDLDGYYKELDYVNGLDYTHDNPDSIDLLEAISHLKQLKAGNAVQVPIYNFASHSRQGYRVCEPASVIVVEGIFSFTSPQLLQEFDLKVWVEADEEIRYQRRLKRDVEERGREMQEVVQHNSQSVVPGYELFIEPTKKAADITIHNNAQSIVIPEGLYAILAYCLLKNKGSTMLMASKN
jgi:uridine kinase